MQINALKSKGLTLAKDGKHKYLMFKKTDLQDLSENDSSYPCLRDSDLPRSEVHMERESGRLLDKTLGGIYVRNQRGSSNATLLTAPPSGVCGIEAYS